MPNNNKNRASAPRRWLVELYIKKELVMEKIQIYLLHTRISLTIFEKKAPSQMLHWALKLPLYIMPSVTPLCCDYHYCTTSFNYVWTQVLRRFMVACRSFAKVSTSDSGLGWKRLTPFRRSTIPKKHHHHHYHHRHTSYLSSTCVSTKKMVAGLAYKSSLKLQQIKIIQIMTKPE